MGDELAVSRQREDCLKLCERRGWTPVEYVDNDTSASNGKRRPAYTQMLADIRAGRVGAVVAWDADRLHRQPRELEDFIDLADAHKLALATVGGDFDLSTPTGRGNARMKGVFARMEMEQKSARQKRAERQLAESGKPHRGGRRPFGYTRDNKVFEPEASAVRDGYADILAGATLHSVAARWNAAGLKTTAGNDWTGTTVKQTLTKPRYAGLRAYHGEIVGKAEWEAIVTEDVWRSLCDLLAQRSPSRPFPARKYLLTSIAVCGVCGRPVGSSAKTDSAPVYKCKECGGVTRQIDKTDRWVIEHVVARLSQPDAAQVLVRENRADMPALRAEANALRSRLDALATDFAEGDLTASQLRTATERIKAKLSAVESQMFDANSRRMFDGLIGAEDVRAAFDALPLDRQRAVVDALLSVTIMPVGKGRAFDPERVVLKWKTGRG
ncbi:hypothetical protein MELE44368_12405 [Mycolicibacterium elephantis DSM 44368]|uniref:Serine recombinase n=1 Tax=Mycolicibacterium elephantis DSM 44368 TaxID=1335622 RepID=A0A439DYE8_9MYCO|nr:hypothetical protein MELE44368_12405 [Mycolicibacterium elephantis DSM 44368]